MLCYDGCAICALQVLKVGGVALLDPLSLRDTPAIVTAAASGVPVKVEVLVATMD